MRLTELRDRLAVCRLAADADPPGWARGELTAVVRTPDELSVVCSEDAVPDGVTAERGWTCLRVEGPLDLSLTGVMAALSAALAETGVPVFAISTYDTDYLLVPGVRIDAAIEALRAAGHSVTRC